MNEEEYTGNQEVCQEGRIQLYFGRMQPRLYPIKLYLKHKPNLILLSVGLILNIAAWIWLSWNIGFKGEQIFLHYNVLFGVDLIGPRSHMFFVPGMGLMILIVNALIGWVFFRNDRFVSLMFNTIGSVAQIVILTAVQLIILLNV